MTKSFLAYLSEREDLVQVQVGIGESLGDQATGRIDRGSGPRAGRGNPSNKAVVDLNVDQLLLSAQTGVGDREFRH